MKTKNPHQNQQQQKRTTKTKKELEINLSRNQRFTKQMTNTKRDNEDCQKEQEQVADQSDWTAWYQEALKMQLASFQQTV